MNESHKNSKKEFFYLEFCFLAEGLNGLELLEDGNFLIRRGNDSRIEDGRMRLLHLDRSQAILQGLIQLTDVLLLVVIQHKVGLIGPVLLTAVAAGGQYQRRHQKDSAETNAHQPGDFQQIEHVVVLDGLPVEDGQRCRRLLAPVGGDPHFQVVLFFDLSDCDGLPWEQVAQREAGDAQHADQQADDDRVAEAEASQATAALPLRTPARRTVEIVLPFLFISYVHHFMSNEIIISISH